LITIPVNKRALRSPLRVEATAAETAVVKRYLTRLEIIERRAQEDGD
jgi:hypothetical protein